MAKLKDISLLELYDRKITSSVEKAILEKEDFSKHSELWCEKVCKLKCKNPPIRNMYKKTHFDVMIIQDINAFDDVKFNRKGAGIERKHKHIIDHIAKSTLGMVDKEGSVIGFSFNVTNLVKCQIEVGDLNRGKPPMDTVLSKCRPYVLQEIEECKPKLIISLNTSVTKALGIKKTNYRDCGDIAEYKGIPVVITLHPRILLMLRQNSSGKAWGSDFYSIIERDFMKAGGILRGIFKVPNLDEAIERAKKQIHVARNIDDAKRFCDILTEAGLSGSVESFDTETTGLDPWAENAKIILMQFGVRNKETNLIDAYVFPMWHRDNTMYPPGEAWEFIKPILINDRIKKVGHNFKFDILYVEVTLGVRIQGVLFDTMLLLHAINSGLQGMYGLKRAVGNWLPDIELAGYEDKLPKLTKIKKGAQDGIEGDIETETEVDDSAE